MLHLMRDCARSTEPDMEMEKRRAWRCLFLSFPCIYGGRRTGGGGAIVFEKLSSLAAALAAKYAEEGGRGRNTRYQSRITESRFIPGIIGPVRNKRFDDGRKR